MDSSSLNPFASSHSHQDSTHPPDEGPPGSGRVSKPQLSIPAEDLLDDKLILAAPRIEFEGRKVPALGGIAMLAKLGQGGMGAVYYGYHPRLRKEVAVKVLPFHLAQTRPHLLERFAREAQIAGQIQSPHLVSVSDINQESGLWYLVMELVPGQSARKFLEVAQATGKKYLDEATALDICIAACEGLAVAHSRGVIHRDIKPDNILLPYRPAALEPSNRGSKSDVAPQELDVYAAKLADLGLARSESIEQSLTGSMDVMGTPGFLAPEQAMDAKAVGKAADVFGMGATLYALLSGGPPFLGETTVQVIFATMNKAHVPIARVNPNVSRVTATLIDHCLAKNPQKRYADGAVLCEALRVCREALGHDDAQQQNAITQIVNLLHSGGAVSVQSAGKGKGSTYIANPKTVDDDVELERILRNRPKEFSTMSDPGKFRRLRLVLPLMLLGGMFSYWFYALQGGGAWGHGVIMSPGARAYEESHRAPQEAIEKAKDPAKLDEAIADLRELIDKYQDNPAADLEQAQYTLMELEQRKAGKGPDGKPLPGEKEDPQLRVVKKDAPKAMQVTQEGDEDGRLITRVYSPVQEIDLGAPLRQIACSPSGRELYVIHNDRPLIRIFDPATLEQTGEIQTPKNPVNIWCDERRIIAACDLSQVIATYDTFTHLPLKSVTWTAEPAMKPVRVLGPAPGGGLSAVWRKGEERDWERALTTISDTGTVTRVLKGQIDWGVYMPDGKHFIAQSMNGNSPSSKSTNIFDIASGKQDRMAADLFRPGYGFQAGSSHTFWTADGRHLVISSDRINSQHGYQAWTYLANRDLTSLEISYCGTTVAEIPDQGILVSWGTVVEKNTHQSSGPPEVFYVSRSTGRILRRVSMRDYLGGSRDMHLTLSPDRNTLYVPRHELLLTFNPDRFANSTKLLVVRCGPVPADKEIQADPNLVVRNSPPKEIKAGEAFTFFPEVEFMPPLKAKSPEISYKLREAPAGATVDAKTGRISWTPGLASIGIFDFKLVAVFDSKIEALVLHSSVRVKP
jgi:serine/threonine protein kinase